eukprot:215077_1
MLRRVNYTLGYQIAYMCLCIYVIYVFGHIGCLVWKRILRNKEHIIRQKHFTMITSAWILWICIIVVNVGEMLFRTNIIVPFDHPTCMWWGKITFILRSTGLFCYQIVFLEPIIEIFKLSPSLKCSETSLRISRVVMLLLTINTDVMIIYYGEFYHTHLTDYRSFWVCQQPNLSEIPVWPISLSALAGISTLIVICIVFMYKTYKLITKTPKILMMQRSIFGKAQALVEVNIKHTLLMSSSVLWFVVIVNIDSKLLNVLPLGFLGVGMAAYMVFEFGETKYDLIFGRLHLFLLNKWLSRYPSLPTSPK